MAYDPNCLRRVANWTTLEKEHKFEKETFNPTKFFEDLPMASPKLYALLENIRTLDEQDIVNHGKIFKHFIFSEVKQGGYGAKIISSGLMAYGMNLCYTNKLQMKSDNELLESTGGNFAFLCSTTLYDQVLSSGLKKSVLETFNRRPDNVQGDLIRIMVADAGFKEGIDLFDVKYVHIFEPQTSEADQKQAIGRATRKCGQAGLDFHPTKGWALHVFIYDIAISQRLMDKYNSKTLFDMYLKQSKIDFKKMNFSQEVEKLMITGSVDYPLNQNILNYRIEDDMSVSHVVMEGGEEKLINTSRINNPILTNVTVPLNANKNPTDINAFLGNTQSIQNSKQINSSSIQNNTKQNANVANVNEFNVNSLKVNTKNTQQNVNSVNVNSAKVNSRNAQLEQNVNVSDINVNSVKVNARNAQLEQNVNVSGQNVAQNVQPELNVNGYSVNANISNTLPFPNTNAINVNSPPSIPTMKTVYNYENNVQSMLNTKNANSQPVFKQKKPRQHIPIKLGTEVLCDKVCSIHRPNKYVPVALPLFVTVAIINDAPLPNRKLKKPRSHFCQLLKSMPSFCTQVSTAFKNQEAYVKANADVLVKAIENDKHKELPRSLRPTFIRYVYKFVPKPIQDKIAIMPNVQRALAEEVKNANVNANAFANVNVNSNKNANVDKNVNSSRNVNADKNANVGKNVNADKNANADKNTNVGKNVNADKNTNVDKNVNADKNANVGKNVNADKNVNVDKNVNADKNANVGKNVNADKNANADKNTNVDKNVNADKNANVDKNVNVKENSNTQHENVTPKKELFKYLLEDVPKMTEKLPFRQMQEYIVDNYGIFTWPKVKLENLCVSSGGEGVIFEKNSKKSNVHINVANAGQSFVYTAQHNANAIMKEMEESMKLDDEMVLKDLNEGVNKSLIAKFSPTQDFIRHYFTTQSPYKGMLLWHSVGTGKTCTAIATASSTFEREGYTILWVTRTTLKDDIWKNMFDTVCSLSMQERLTKGTKIPQKMTDKMKLVPSNWSIRPMSYKSFTNLVSASNKMYHDLVKKNGVDDPLRKTLIIIDEAHKLFSGFDLLPSEKPDMKKFKAALNKSYSVSGANSVKLLLMSATPYSRDILEMMKLINLLKEPNEQIPTNFDDFSQMFLDNEGHFTNEGKELFLNYITGLVSYLDRGSDAREFAQPQIQLINVKMSERPVADIAALKKENDKNVAAIKNIIRQLDESFLIFKKAKMQQLREEVKIHCEGLKGLDYQDCRNTKTPYMKLLIQSIDDMGTKIDDIKSAHNKEVKKLNDEFNKINEVYENNYSQEHNIELKCIREK